MSILSLWVEIQELIENGGDNTDMDKEANALNLEIKKFKNGTKDPSPSPSPPSSHAQTVEPEDRDAQSSVGGEYFFMEVNPQERAIILQAREMVGEAVQTLVKQRDSAHRRCDKMWHDAMVAYFEQHGMDVPSWPEITEAMNNL